MRTRNTRNRTAFTLIELMGVIAIIAILVSLLTMAANSAWSSAKAAKAKIEISQLETAIAAFKAQFGTEPPSRIVLCENGADWLSEPRSMAIIRRLWPQFDFNLNHDINRNTAMSEKLILDAAECLVFFLGGTIDDGVSLNGFSRNVSDPFQRNTQATRIGPFYEFDINRLIDDDNDGIAAYQDTYAAGDPIVYFSNYDGQGFDPIDLTGGGWTMQDFYRPVTAGKPYSHSGSQIVSPGPDGILGQGGLYSPDKPLGERFHPPTIAQAAGWRQDEYDNLTNFQTGMLGR